MSLSGSLQSENRHSPDEADDEDVQFTESTSKFKMVHLVGIWHGSFNMSTSHDQAPPRFVTT